VIADMTTCLCRPEADELVRPARCLLFLMLLLLLLLTDRPSGKRVYARPCTEAGERDCEWPCAGWLRPGPVLLLLLLAKGLVLRVAGHSGVVIGTVFPPTGHRSSADVDH